MKVKVYLKLQNYFRVVKIFFPVPQNPLALLPSQYTQETKEEVKTIYVSKNEK